MKQMGDAFVERPLGCFGVKKVLLKLCVWVAFATVMNLPSYGQPFAQVSGSIDMVITPVRSAKKNTNDIHRTIPFACLVATNGMWRVDEYLSYLGGSEDKIFFDGTIRYDGVQIPSGNERYAGRSNVSIEPFDSHRQNSAIQILIVPSSNGVLFGDDGGELEIPWLAFCSGSYLKRRGRSIPVPIVYPIYPFRNDRFDYSDQVTLFNDGLGLPKEVKLFSIRNTNASKELLKFYYFVTESTNYMGWTIPLKFEYQENGYDLASNWICWGRGDGHVTSIKSSSMSGGIFLAGAKQNIMDFRFNEHTDKIDVNGFTYSSTNGFLTPTNDPELQKEYTEWKIRYAAHVGRAGHFTTPQ